jgi:hypothetical protein
MKKLLFVILLLPALAFGQTQLSINQVAPNFQTAGIWKSTGTIMTPETVADQSNLQEPNVIYEGSPQILTDATNVYKMLFTAGGTTQGIYYAESVDGQIWSRRATVSIANHARTFVMKSGSTYYCFCAPTAGGFAQIDVYSSTDMVTWTLAQAAIITVSGSAGWNHQSLANLAVYFDGTTYQMLLSANATGGGPFTTGYYHSTSITSGWIAYGSNPVMGNTTNQELAPGTLTKIGSTFYAWMFGGMTTGNLPTDIYRYHSADMMTWVADNSGSPTYPRVQGDEGVGETGGQVANPCLIEVNGQSHMFFSAVSNGAGLAPGLHLKQAISNYNITNLVTTNEGNGTGYNFAQPLAYSRVASDVNYVTNATNVGANLVWTVGSILLTSDPNIFGIRIRDPSVNTTLSVVTPGNLDLYKAGAHSYLNALSTKLTIGANGGIDFNNGSGSGAASLGTFDNSGLLTTTNGVTTNASGFNFASAAFGATATNGATLRNQTAATGSVLSRWSPTYYQNGTAWTGAASQLIQFYQVLKPVSGTNPVTYNYEWVHNINFASDVTVMRLSNLGVLSVSGLNASGLTASKVVFTDASKNLTSTGIGTALQYIAGDGSLGSLYTGLITGTPTIVAGTGAGTSPTVSVTTNGKQLQVTVTTGTLPTGTNATIATVTLPNALSYTPLPVFSSASAATALLNGASMIYMTSTGTANVTITSGTTALTAATTYVWNVSL